MYSLIIGLGILILYWVYEYYRHQYFRRKIPVIIHINGTRGKSSVTRLVAAGLRAGGKRTMAKTTGSAPVLIFEDGGEIPIKRPFGANIREQLKIISFAAKRKVDCLVLECMAVAPEYQWVTEHEMVKADIGVISNSRPDHLDLMGPGLKNVTLSLCNTLPRKGKAFTSEKYVLPLMKKQAARTGTELHYCDKDQITLDDLKGFNYIEHRENIALALDVCRNCGVSRETALQGMYLAKPDIGAAEIFSLTYQGKKIFFVHSFAANDPQSTEFLINYVREIHPHLESVAMVLNTRADRMFRSKQLISMMTQLEFDELYLIGDQAQSIRSYGISKGLPPGKLHRCGWVTGEVLLERIGNLKAKEILLFGIGNIGGNGGAIVKYFRERDGQNV